MKTILNKGLNTEQKEVMKKDFIGAVFLRQQLTAILNEKIESARIASRSVKAYEDPNWSFRQADTVGYERALAEVISLLSD